MKHLKPCKTLRSGQSHFITSGDSARIPSFAVFSTTAAALAQLSFFKSQTASNKMCSLIEIPRWYTRAAIRKTDQTIRSVSGEVLMESLNVCMYVFVKVVQGRKTLYFDSVQSFL